MDDWRYDTAADLAQPLTERLKRFPREPDMLVHGARSLAAAGVRCWLRIVHRLTITGREHLPADRSFVMVANHASHLDTLCLLSAVPFARVHRAFPAAAADYFFTSVPRTALAAVVVNALPFNRTDQPRHSLALCRKLLEDAGNVLILFPEGTRSRTGAMGEFKPGVGLLLAGTDVPVVPCRLDGAFEALPKGRLLPRPTPIRLTIGPPRNYAGLRPGKESAVRITRELRDAVEGLGG